MSRITIKDDLHPEDAAMSQSLYSRSPAPIEEHLAKIAKVGSGKFMEQFYVGFGHQSIGDCGSTTIYIENVSMLAAKAIQDWPLYSGQETSTRFVDWSKQEIADPVGTQASREIQAGWMAFYHRAQEPLLGHLRGVYPRKDGEDEKIYERALKARCFDVMRGFIPAGALTSLSWHTNLRQAADHLDWLFAHPEPAIRDLAVEIHRALAERYPHSFKDTAGTGDRHRFYDAVMAEHNYYDFKVSPTWPRAWDEMGKDVNEPASWVHVNDHAGVSLLCFWADDLYQYHGLLSRRPRKAMLPHWMTGLGSIRSRFLLDFGSFRDLQRHRNGVVRMPLLTMRYGFEPWYLAEMPVALRAEAEGLLEAQAGRIRVLHAGETKNADMPWAPSPSEIVKQHYIPMGFRVPCEVVQGLPAFVYRMELRSGKTIHPTFRRIVQEEARQFHQRYPFVALHADMDPDDWTVRRGAQTIEEKASV